MNKYFGMLVAFSKPKHFFKKKKFLKKKNDWNNCNFIYSRLYIEYDT